MNREEIIKIIENHSNNAELFKGRFIKINDFEYKWVIPAVDTYNVQIKIEDDVVKHSTKDYVDDKIIILTYYELINKYKL